MKTEKKQPKTDSTTGKDINYMATCPPEKYCQTNVSLNSSAGSAPPGLLLTTEASRK